MRIGIAQINTVAGAFDQTVERMVTQSKRAVEQGVELLVFPLAALAGIELVSYADRPGFLADVAEAVVTLSEQLACPAIVPVPIDTGGYEGSFDALLLEEGQIRPLRTTASPAATSDEAAELEVPEFSFGDLRFALAFTHDELDALDDYDYDVDAVLFISGYPFAMDDPSSVMAADLEGARFVDDVRACNAWMVGVAPVGAYSDQVFCGSSFVLAPTGELVASAPAFEESLTVAEVQVTYDPTRHEPLAPEVFDLPFHAWQAVSLGIHDFVTKTGGHDVALVLDGSLGSLVLLALASDALGPLHVHALVGSSAGPAAPVAREVARRLRVDQVDGAAPPRGLDPRDFDELMTAQLARAHDALVLSSLDKTALALGLGTSQVSAAVLCPLGDIYRSDVLDMAHVRNTISPLFRRVAMSPTDIFGLPLPDGSELVIADEHTLTKVDETLLGFIEYDRPLAELARDESVDAELVEAVLKAHRLGETARRAKPPVLAMSTHTLDDSRFPLMTSWHDTHFDEQAILPPRAQDEGDEREGSDAPRPARALHDSSQRPGNDIESTLAMLRDIVEQGGLVPPGAELSVEFAEGDAAASGSSEGEQRSPLGWMTPFSEN